jgi:4-diphosphocytidyl-2-C-methyl-D-erythritol kinase
MSPPASSQRDGSPIVKTLRAPAKLNLGLRVVGRRADGYHLIESCFVPLDLADELTVTVSEAPRSAGADVDASSTPGVDLVVRAGDSPGEVPHGASNLAAKAARRFLTHTGRSLRVAVSLQKRIPAGAGMGGGSSDAGAVLRALAEICRVPVDSLSDLALGLGADVPYFLDPQPALVSGVGERIERLEGLPPFCFLLVNPGISLATTEVFRAFDGAASSLTLARPGSTMRALSELRAGPGVAGALESLLVNDLEPAAQELCPQIAQLRDRLGGLGAEATGMSGSGATVFGLFPSVAAAREALERAGFAHPIWARVAQTVGSV